MPPVPIGVLLKRARSLDRREVVAGAGYKLKADRQFVFGEAAGNGKRRQPAKIANAAQRVGKSKSGF